MKLLEFFHRVSEPWQDRSEDQSQAQRSDARKTRLTLRQINRLRRMDDVRQIEHSRKLKQLKDIYGAPAATNELMM